MSHRLKPLNDLQWSALRQLAMCTHFERNRARLFGPPGAHDLVGFQLGTMQALATRGLVTMQCSGGRFRSIVITAAGRIAVARASRRARDAQPPVSAGAPHV